MNFKPILIFSLVFVYCDQSNSIDNKQFQFKISYIHNLIQNENWNCSEVIYYFMQRSTRYNKALNAIINYNPNVYQVANELDEFYYKNKKIFGKLHCIPFAVKDNIDVLGMPTTGAIKALRNSFPRKNAPIIDRLLSEGAVVISKTNLGELANGIDVSELGGQCHNPFDYKRSCGPSSIGSGAAIASGLGIIGLGTDTDRSIQSPGSFNGIYSLRTPLNIPTIEGIIPLFERHDTVGPLSKHIDDLVLTYSIMINNSALYDNYLNYVDESNIKIGIITNFIEDIPDETIFGLKYLLDPQVKSILDQTLSNLKGLNINLNEYTLSKTEISILFRKVQEGLQKSIGCIVGCKKSSLNKYFGDSSRFEHDAPVKSFDDLFNSQLLSEFCRNDLNASNVSDPEKNCADSCRDYDIIRKEITESIKKWYEFNNFDSIILPTYTQLPPFADSPYPGILPSLATLASITGFPSLNIPIGYSSKSKEVSDGLPIGMVLITKPSSLHKAFKIAKLLENKFPQIKLPSSVPLIVSKLKNSALILKPGLAWIKISIIAFIVVLNFF